MEETKITQPETTPAVTEAQGQAAPVTETPTPSLAPEAAKSQGATLALITVTAIAVVVLGFLYFTKNSKEPSNEAAVVSSILNLEEGTEAVAKVNGVTITKTEFKKNVESLLESVTSQGLDANDATIQVQIKDQALTTLTNNQVLIQAAHAANISVTDAEVETEYQNILTRLGGKEAVDGQLAKLGMDETSLRANIRDALTVTAYIDKEVKPSTMTVSDEEVISFYESLKGEKEGVPALEEIHGQIEQQLLSEKQQAAVGQFLEGLRSAAKIEVLI